MAYKPGSVLQREYPCSACHLSVPDVAVIAIAVYPPARASNPQTPVYMTLQLPGRTAHGVTTSLVGSYPTFSPLPYLHEAVIFFCVLPAVADTLHINKRDALCCPDFPHTPWWSKRQTVQLLSRPQRYNKPSAEQNKSFVFYSVLPLISPICQDRFFIWCFNRRFFMSKRLSLSLFGALSQK